MRLFFVTTLLGGFGAAAGSMIGHFFGQNALNAGAVLGGMVAVAFAVWVAAKFAWIRRRNFRLTLVGGEIGFLVAAAVAVRMLSSPIGPILSSMLIGAGALIGSRVDTGEKANGVDPQA
ncbi:MAG: hypothetical protein H0W63_02345 [Gemmatimonadaceae bacterium]|nr:hypothetical protein [Gemmatimonadaceae bacterium]